MADGYSSPDPLGQSLPRDPAADSADAGSPADASPTAPTRPPTLGTRLRPILLWIRRLSPLQWYRSGRARRAKARPGITAQRKREKLSLKRAGAVAAVLVAFVPLAIGGVVLLVAMRDAGRNVVVLERLEVSDDLKAKGYSAEVLTRFLGDELTAIELASERQRVQEIESAAEPILHSPSPGEGKMFMVGQQGMRGFRLASDGQGADFEIPKTGISRTLLVGMIRELRGRPAPRVTGEVFSHGDNLGLHVRVGGGAAFRWEGAPEQLRGGLRKAAVHVMRQARPITLGRYYQAADPAKLYNFVMYCLQSRTVQEDAAAYDLLGQYWYERGAAGSAVESFRQAIRLDPEYGPARLNLAIVLLKQKRFDAAIGQLQKARRAGNVSRAAVLNAWGVALETSGDAAGAERMYLAARQSDPADALVLLNLADLQVARGQPGRAIPLYRQALQRNAALPGVRTGWGNALLARGDLDGAIGRFREELQVNPGYARAWRGLANAHRDHFRADPPTAADTAHLLRSLTLYDSAARADSRSADTYVQWGLALQWLERMDTAQQLLRRAVGLDSAYSPAYVGLGYTFYHGGQYDSAAYWYGEAARVDPSSAWAFENWGLALLTLNRLRDAEAKLRRAAELDERAARPHLWWGYALLQRGAFHAALLHMRRAEQLAGPHDPDAAVGLGKALVEGSDPNQAIPYFQRAIRRAPGFSMPYTGWGQALLRLGKRREAEQKFREALERNPDPEAYDGLGDLAWFRRDTAAVRHYCDAVAVYAQSYTSYFRLGKLRRDQRRFGLARANFRRAFELDPQGWVGGAARLEDQSLRRRGPPAARADCQDAPPAGGAT